MTSAHSSGHGSGSASTTCAGEWTAHPVPVYIEARCVSQKHTEKVSVREAVTQLVAKLPIVTDGPLSFENEPDLLNAVQIVRVSGLCDRGPDVDAMQLSTASASHAAEAAVPTEAVSDIDAEEVSLNRSAPPCSLPFWKVSPRIHLYACHGADTDFENSSDEDTEQEQEDKHQVKFSTLSRLPAMHLEGLWESLQYHPHVKSKLLEYISSGFLFHKYSVDPQLITWNRVVLLHGPPGTGKTSLCRALAQKLAIRLEAKKAVLVEVHSDELFSKWFSESSTNVGRLFKKIAEIACTSDYVFVLLDEVESLASVRNGESSSEPSDALRVVNSLLTALDTLRSLHNCLILATSNLTHRIDSAFMDRVDLQHYVGLPAQTARFNILRSCVDELLRRHILAQCETENTDQKDPEKSMEMLLVQAARAAKGLSGRSLRKLPLLAHASYIRGAAKDVSVTRFLKALRITAAKARRRSA